MPVAQGGPPPARQALTVGIAALLGLLAMVFLVTRFDQLGGSGESGTVDLGGAVFQFGQADEFAPAIAESGPLLLPDAASGQRDVWLQHLGDDPNEGWSAFAARPEGADRECFVEWRPDSQDFLDVCDETVYPADGEGLVQYAVSVSPEGDLTINLNPVEESE